jgi:hypothetical protein
MFSVCRPLKVHLVFCFVSGVNFSKFNFSLCMNCFGIYSSLCSAIILTHHSFMRLWYSFDKARCSALNFSLSCSGRLFHFRLAPCVNSSNPASPLSKDCANKPKAFSGLDGLPSDFFSYIGINSGFIRL